MKIQRIGVVFLLFMSAFAGEAPGSEPRHVDVLQSIQTHIKPLSHPMADRLPIVTWQSRNFPTGLENGQVAEVQQLFMDRGLSPLCNPIGSASTAKEYVPILKYRQRHGFPVCILPQGWLQIHFVSDRRGRYKAPHLPPAESSEEYPCVSALKDSRRIAQGAARTNEVLGLLRDHGIKVTLLVVDFESGAYLRNTGAQAEIWWPNPYGVA